MKANYFLKSIILALFIGMNAPSVLAQKNIDKLLDEIENRDDASINSIVKRDPKTRTVISVVKSFTLTDAKMAQRLIEAFEKDEEYTVTAIKDMPKGKKEASRINFTYIFQKDNEKRTYNFSVNQKEKISLSVIIKQKRAGDVDMSDFTMHFNQNFDIPAINEEQMKEIQRSIDQSLKKLKIQNKIKDTMQI